MELVRNTTHTDIKVFKTPWIKEVWFGLSSSGAGGMESTSECVPERKLSDSLHSKCLVHTYLQCRLWALPVSAYAQRPFSGQSEHPKRKNEIHNDLEVAPTKTPPKLCHSVGQTWQVCLVYPELLIDSQPCQTSRDKRLWGENLQYGWQRRSHATLLKRTWRKQFQKRQNVKNKKSLTNQKIPFSNR